MDDEEATLLAAWVSIMVDHEHLIGVIIGTSFPEMIPGTVFIMDLGAFMLLAALVSIVDHEKLTVVIIGTRSWEMVPDTVSIMDFAETILLVAVVSMVYHSCDYRCQLSRNGNRYCLKNESRSGHAPSCLTMVNNE